MVAAALTPGGAAAASWFQLPASLAQAESPQAQCREAIRRQEMASGIPTSLMTAISLVESGRRMPDGKFAAWPWSINAQGVDHIYQSKAEAIAGVRALQAEGVQSIDVGCMQVNLMYHAGAFATLEDAFDPVHNAEYAAGFLTQLRTQTGSWQLATADYHSATPELGMPYERKVRAMMSEDAARELPEIRELSAGATPAHPFAAASLSAGSPSAGQPFGGLFSNRPMPAALPFGGVHQAPVFFARAPAQMIRSLVAGSGRSLDAYRSAPIMLNYQVRALR